MATLACCLAAGVAVPVILSGPPVAAPGAVSSQTRSTVEAPDLSGDLADERRPSKTSERAPQARVIAVTLMGAVKTPGRYELPTGSTLSDLIEMAGGLTDWGYLNKVSITQGGVETLYDFRQKEPSSYRLSNEELVTIPERIF